MNTSFEHMMLKVDKKKSAFTRFFLSISPSKSNWFSHTYSFLSLNNLQRLPGRLVILTHRKYFEPLKRSINQSQYNEIELLQEKTKLNKQS